MAVSVSVLIPWRPGCPHRRAAFDWVTARYKQRYPEWTVIVGRGDESGPWIKADAVADAIQRTDAEVLVVSDSDVWCYGLEDAVRAVVCGVSAWSVPHGKTHRLTPEATEGVLAGEEPSEETPTTEVPYVGVSGGGLVAARRETLLDVPLDPRFVGWGQEDGAWAVALAALHGGCWRGTAPLFHLWHPPQDRRTRRLGSRENSLLRRRYGAARDDPEQMRRLIEEVHDACRQADAAGDLRSLGGRRRGPDRRGR